MVIKIAARYLQPGDQVKFEDGHAIVKTAGYSDVYIGPPPAHLKMAKAIEVTFVGRDAVYIHPASEVSVTKSSQN